MYKPVFWELPLAVWQMKHLLMKLVTSLLSCGQKNLGLIAAKVLSWPKFPAYPLECASLIIASVKDV